MWTGILLIFLGSTVLEPRPLVDVTTVGALPDDGKDDTIAVQNAINLCLEKGMGGIYFPEGVYHFAEGKNPEAGHVAILLRDVQDFVIDGGGSTFIGSGLLNLLQLSNCTNIEVRNFTLDWDRPTFSVGEVVSSEAGVFDVQVYDEFPVVGGEPVQAFMDFDPETKLPRRLGLDVYHGVEKTELIAPQVLRVTGTHPFEVAVGSIVVLRHQVYAYNALTSFRGSDIQYENITIYTTPGMGVVASRTENLTLDNVNVMIKPNTRRYCSATADAVHLSGCLGDIVIRNCTFEGMGDDAVNMKTGLYLTVHEQLDERTVIGRHNLNMQHTPDAGDMLELTPPDTMRAYATLEVAEAQTMEDMVSARITFTEPLPDTFTIGHLLGNITTNPRVHISNCTVRANRARGMLVQTRHVLIEDCHFENTTSGGIWVIVEVTHFYESIPARNVIIRNNRFINCNYGGPLGSAVIGAIVYLKDFKRADSKGVFRNIIIENNVIDQALNSGIHIMNAENVIVRGNKITRVSQHPVQGDGDAAIFVDTSKYVVIENNTVQMDEQGEGCKEVLRLGEQNDLVTFQIRDNIGF